MNTDNIKIQGKQKLGDDIINMYKPYENKKITWKKTVLNNVVFDLPDYYLPMQLIGSGAYGAVAAAVDLRLPVEQREENMIAIKKMTNVFEHKIYARRVLRQLRLLRLLKHPNIIDLQTIILPRSREDFKDVYAIFQLMDSDVTSVLKKASDQLSEDHFQYFLYQILTGLHFLHSANVVHRDLKTRNLLIDANCNLKICDFGLARTLANCGKEAKGVIMTDYVATRWYRAPQLLLGETNYTAAVDIWSVGCIMAELSLKKPFLPATSTRQQLELICETVEMADLSGLKHRNPDHYDIITKIIIKKKKRPSNFIDEKIKNFGPQGIDLLKKMLKIDPYTRITAKQALNHPYFSQFKNAGYETDCDPINPLQLQFDNHSLTTQQLKDLIYQQILLYHFPDFCKTYLNNLKTKTSVITHILESSNAKYWDPITDADDDSQQ